MVLEPMVITEHCISPRPKKLKARVTNPFGPILKRVFTRKSRKDERKHNIILGEPYCRAARFATFQAKRIG